MRLCPSDIFFLNLSFLVLAYIFAILDLILLTVSSLFLISNISHCSNHSNCFTFRISYNIPWSMTYRKKSSILKYDIFPSWTQRISKCLIYRLNFGKILWMKAVLPKSILSINGAASFPKKLSTALDR
jgi:hypothetical protein